MNKNIKFAFIFMILIGIIIFYGINLINALGLDVNGGTINICGNNNYDYVNITNGATVTICSYNGTAGTGYWNVTASSYFYLSSNSIINGGGAGYRGSSSGGACYGGAGGNGELAGSGGANGGGGGYPGYGWSPGYGGGAGVGGNGASYSSAQIDKSFSFGYGAGAGGAGGGCDNPSGGCSGGGAGSNGGGALKIYSININLLGTIILSGNVGGNGGHGANGGNYGYHGGGGGGGGGGASGGTLLLEGRTINISSSTITINGGNGGSGGGGGIGDAGSGGGNGDNGGAGSTGNGGRIKIFYTYQLFNNSVNYNLGTGTLYTQFDNYFPIINLTYPTSTFSSTRNLTFNCSSYVNTTDTSYTIQNISLFINGNLNQTKIFTTNYANASFSLNVTSDQTINWSCFSCSNYSDCNHANNYTLIVQITTPIIQVTVPFGNINYGYKGSNNTLNYSITGNNIDSCWYTYENKNYTIGCGINASSFIFNISKTLRISANNTLGLSNTYDVNFDFNMFANSITYNNMTIEGNIETFILNSTLYPLVIFSSATFIYNGINYYPSIIQDSGGNYILSSIINIPAVTSNVNKTFYWNVTTSIGNFLTTSYNQTVLDISLSTNCTTGYGFLNLSNFDEENLNLMNGTVEYILLLQNSNSQITQINGTITGTSISICSSQNLSGSYLNYNLQMRYYTADYFYKTYNIQNSEVSNLPLNINLYYLNDSIGIQFKINYVDFNYLKHPNAIIQIQRQYLSTNLYNVVEIPKLDNNGQTIGSFNTNNIRYKLIVVNQGIILDTFNDIFPSCQNIILGTCEINLRGAKSNPSSSVGDFTYTLIKTNNSIILTYIIPSGTPRNIQFLTNQNSRFLNNISNCDISIFASGGTMSCGYNETIGDSIISTQIINSDGTSLYGSIQISEDLSSFYILNNFFISFIFILLLGLIFISSGAILVIVSIVGILYLGLIFLLRGASLITVSGSIAWLIIAGVLIIYKISQKEERT